MAKREVRGELFHAGEIKEFEKARELLGGRGALAYVHVDQSDLSPGAIGNWLKSSATFIGLSGSLSIRNRRFSNEVRPMGCKRKGGTRAGALF